MFQFPAGYRLKITAAGLPGELLAVEVDEVAPATDWVFVCGSARTGTTVARWLITQHPDAVVMNEAWLLGEVLLRLLPQWQAPGLGQMVTKPLLVTLGHADEDTPDEQCVWPASELRRLLELYRCWLAPGVLLFGDKRGGYGLPPWLQLLDVVLPGCRLVLTERDLWDTAASLMDSEFWSTPRRQRGYSDRRLAREALHWVTARYHERELARTRPDVFRLSFERMAECPETELRELLSYLGLDLRDYPWEVLELTHYREAVGHWQRIPALVALRERLEGDHDDNGVMEHLGLSGEW